MKIGLTDSAYQYGSYCREDFRGDILYGVISYAGLEILTASGFMMAEDEWEKRHRARMAPGEGMRYLGRLREAFLEKAEQPAPFEDYWKTALQIRREVFGDRMNAFALIDAEEGDPALSETDYEQTERLEQMIRESRSAAILLEDPRWTKQAQADLERLRAAGLRVYAMVSETAGGCFPGAELASRLLESVSGRAEKRMKAAELQKQATRNAKIASIFCEGALDRAESDEMLELDIEEKKTFLLCYGEKGLTDCRHLSVPAYIRCAPESLIGKALAGQFSRRKKCGIYVPAHFDPVPLVPIRRRTVASYRQMAWMDEKAGDACYCMVAEEMYRRWPEIFFSVYEEKAPRLPKGITWPADSRQDGWYTDFCVRRDGAMGQILEGLPGVKKLGGWFALDSFEEKPVPWSAEGEAKGILVHGFRTERAMDAQVILAEGSPVAPRRLAEKMEKGQTQLMLNYLFFLTPRLKGLYNEMRKARTAEQTHLGCGHLDYMMYEENGRRRETFPLYRKACMGLREDGSFVFFHFRLGGGEITIRGQKLRWERTDVDPTAAGKIAVMTPYSSASDAGAPKFSYTKAVGGGRVNLVMNQDRMICARDGDVLLPCMGVVISLAREEGLRFLTACGFGSANEEGYFLPGEALEAEIRLDPPEDFSRKEWERIRWAFGGGLTLIQEGKNCFETDETAAALLEREGWTSPLSEQTQESDIAAPMRHPRTAIGVTRTGGLFALVFSGRSPVSAGATYPEMCTIAQKLVPDAWELMNVDGGGSAVLGIATEGRFTEMSWPSSSPGTPAGLVRPVQSLLTVRVG